MPKAISGFGNSSSVTWMKAARLNVVDGVYLRLCVLP